MVDQGSLRSGPKDFGGGLIDSGKELDQLQRARFRWRRGLNAYGTVMHFYGQGTWISDGVDGVFCY